MERKQIDGLNIKQLEGASEIFFDLEGEDFLIPLSDIDIKINRWSEIAVIKLRKHKL